MSEARPTDLWAAERPDPQRVLVIKMSSLGDVVHALPVATALRRRYPAVRITWAIEEWAADLVAAHPAIDRVVRWPRMRLPRSSAELSAWLVRARSAVRELRAEPYDVALDLQGLAKSAAVALLSGARRRLGIEGQREGSYFVATAIPARAPGRHAVDENLRAAEHLGAPAEPVRFDLTAGREAGEAIRARLRTEGIGDDRPLIVVAPSASTPRKSPPRTLWIRVTAGLTDLGRVVVVGLPEQRQAHERLAIGGARNWTGTTSLAELVALLEQASLLVSPDSGAAHIAAALGRPVVSLYGPTPAARLAPYGQAERVIRREGLCGAACSVLCANGARCLAAIDPAAVIGAARRALG